MSMCEIRERKGWDCPAPAYPQAACVWIGFEVFHIIFPYRDRVGGWFGVDLKIQYNTEHSQTCKQSQSESLMPKHYTYTDGLLEKFKLKVIRSEC